ncbi:MotA/TolQ/ExbB proton channel family protein [Zhongshania aquimaris]|uniref:MotA/TolQ/ExbB proton channel family protein n=1 Tax=Zhongshania aquimaris TaxID=2857107 RepID=A0ABS6VWA8_9GAMM|nr:MotA/TolQ/ExbB proton channel family protein [Zhongshania aquimaris]MBW2942299.1 MotA/TolQ/ExbB proton channel family protein [Zhongshania aquimaris]|tara:strand:- start:605 stop:1252 length:648 start_codon:yes stop_codon:yes gene_type:complete
MEAITKFVEFFNDGGHFMYPIALVLALSVAISIERFVFLGRSLRENRRLWARVSPLLGSDDLGEAQAMVNGSKVAVARILSEGLAQAGTARRRSELEMATEDSLVSILPAIERRTHYLATFSNAATLLGLLGTVLGLIGAFGALGNADPVEKANLLSAGISEAMSCTAFGLMVAIPSLFAHAYLQSQAEELVNTLESACVRFVSVLSSGGAVHLK